MYSLPPKDLAVGLSATLDEGFSGEELPKVGERIVDVERVYNVR